MWVIRDIMKRFQALLISIAIFIIISSNIFINSTAEDIDSIPPLTMPPTIPNPNAHIDVFERLAIEKQEGYLKDKNEIIEDNFYFTTKQGFDFVHLEGSPSEIGYNHGLLLWEKIERGMASYAFLTEMRYDLTWDMCRAQGATYWPNIPAEYQQEIDGIATGCWEKSARNPDGNVMDRYDIIAYNAMWDIWWRSSYIRSFIPISSLETEPIHHCSGFVANGDYTDDGGFVITQSLWMPYHLPPSHGVFVDIIPESGNRILMELQAGMIWSGTEWYLNDKGLVVGETTLGDAPYQWMNTPAFVRIRQAVQYADSIDEFANIMITNTNGAYCGDYLICDAKSNEAGIVELGSHRYEVWKSDNGFHGSCNYPWDPDVRAEMEEPEGWDHGCFPRYIRLEQISKKYKGEIDCEIAKRTLGDHWDTVEEKENKYHWTLCGHVENSTGYPHGSLDGKTTNRTMTLNHETWARYGHSCGEDFIAADHAREHPEYAYSNLKDMIARPWTTFGFLEPITIKILDENGEPVEGAEIAFENCADGYLSEGITGPDGTYTHPYFQTGTYNITARKGDYRGTIWVEYNQKNTLEIIISENTDDVGLGSGTTTIIIVFCVVIIVAILVTVVYKKFKNK